jgi:hypothetical protein
MDKNERYFAYHVIHKDTGKGYIDKILANSKGEAQDKIDLKYYGKKVRVVYQGIDGR